MNYDTPISPTILIFYNFQNIFENISRMSSIAFLMDWAQMDLDFGLIRQNISIKKAPLLRVPSSSKVWLNSYLYRIRITTNSFYSQQSSLPYILLVCLFRGKRKRRKKYWLIHQNVSIKNIFVFPFSNPWKHK